MVWLLSTCNVIITLSIEHTEEFSFKTPFKSNEENLKGAVQELEELEKNIPVYLRILRSIFIDTLWELLITERTAWENYFANELGPLLKGYSNIKQQVKTHCI